MRIIRWVVVWAVVPSAACVPESPGDSGVDLGGAWADLGAGERDYVPLDEDDSVQIVLGPQGGHMIALGLQAGGILGGDPADPTEPDNPRITYQCLLGDQLLGSITVAAGLQPVGDGALEIVGTWLVFDSSVDTSLYFDEPLRLSALVVDSRGHSAGDEVTVLAVAPEEA